MKTLTELAKIDNLAMKVLKLNSISHIVAHTDRGTLTLVLRKDQTENDYRFTLDAVPMDDVDNKDLLAIFKGVLFN